MKKFQVYIICLLFCYGTSVIGALASVNAGEFYAKLTLPAWAPPGWLFGPVWIALYTAMGIAAALVWLEKGFASSKKILILCFLHLIPNATWSWVFFSLKLGAASFANIVFLWLLILFLCYHFYKINKASFYLLIPYFLWVTFATALNFSIWQLNPNTL